MGEKSYFAVGLKGWVQIRLATRPPRKRESIAEFPYEAQEGGNYDFRRDRWYDRTTVKKVLSLKQVNWEGGRIMLTLPTRSFNRRSALRLKVGDMQAIPSDNPILTFMQSIKKKEVSRG